MTPFAESVVEEAALAWLAGLGYVVRPGPVVVEQTGGAPLLADRLRDALVHLNPTLPDEALDDAFRRLTRLDAPTLVGQNHALHRMLVDGVPVEYRRRDGSIAGAQAAVIDWERAEANDWLAVNQLTVIEQRRNRRPDIVLLVNGLPLAVIELKNPADEQATLWGAYNQLQTYKAEIPSLLAYNAALAISDGLTARLGTLTAEREWFLPWRTVAGDRLAERSLTELQVLIEGAFAPRRFLDLMRYFVVFEDLGGGRLAKKMGAYHQFHAVNVAVEETLRASRAPRSGTAERGGHYHVGHPAGAAEGDRRIGVVWHTQGAGKSLSMVFYAGRVIQHPEMRNPTLVVITDRNDLDQQLFGTFARCQEALRQAPVQAESRADLRDKLRVVAGGVVFTTVQKFLPDSAGDRVPLLSDRRNIVVIADEAHRSQYDFVDGLARHLHDALPNASFIGFTGTPIELTDRNTRAVFGDYISTYDIQQAVLDGATVPIYYESRLAKLALDAAERPRIDPAFEEVTEGEEVERKEALKTRWAQLEAIVGAEQRVALIAADLVAHWEQRLGAMDGKAMVVCMSRRICVALYRALVALRPEWEDTDDARGGIKIVMTGSATDPLDWQPHIRNKERRDALANRFRDPNDPLRIVIVRDMWLTGFDAPCLHTMYVDKPMRGHGLMQAIARVNRVFRDKPGGLVVDYLGLAESLREALATYTASGGGGETAIDQGQAVAAMLEKYDICRGLFHGFDYGHWIGGSPAQRLSLLPAAQEHILAQDKGKERLLQAVSDLSKAFVLAVPHDAALRIRDDVGFFQTVRAALVKGESDGRRAIEELDLAIRQIVSTAITSGGVVDIFAEAGLKRPNISILSDEFLATVSGMPQRNLAVELLRRLLAGEIRRRARRNVVQARSFAAMLEQALHRYESRAIETAQVIQELIALAREMREASARGETLGLTDDELAFYDALETNDSAVKVLGDETLRTIARELVDTVRRNVTVDWTVRENVRAQLRVYVKRILRKYGYPPDKQEKATQTVLEQAEVLSEGWAA